MRCLRNQCQTKVDTLALETKSQGHKFMLDSTCLLQGFCFESESFLFVLQVPLEEIFRLGMPSPGANVDLRSEMQRHCLASEVLRLPDPGQGKNMSCKNGQELLLARTISETTAC